jgi:hypothetical protein
MGRVGYVNGIKVFTNTGTAQGTKVHTSPRVSLFYILTPLHANEQT